MSRVALLPLDDRPVNYDHPWWLGSAAGIDVIRPLREWLGSPLRAPGESKTGGVPSRSEKGAWPARS